ncbi:heavy-metal-associated domain-containing protein [Aquihabitans daechungensis]|uniref:heavy-metal-associated domain-containing protein n=1 Tax=Aquihabitans daechungensis TaxID=1052257 RepID=UPI003BA33790
MSEITKYTVDGMTCSGCANNVAGELKRLEGVMDVDVDLSSGVVTITSDAPVDTDAVTAAVHDAGYEVVS